MGHSNVLEETDDELEDNAAHDGDHIGMFKIEGLFFVIHISLVL